MIFNISFHEQGILSGKGQKFTFAKFLGGKLPFFMLSTKNSFSGTSGQK